jgi:hypothetical protein
MNQILESLLKIVKNEFGKIQDFRQPVTPTISGSLLYEPLKAD